MNSEKLGQKRVPSNAKRFAYPKGSSIDIRWSRKGRRLADEMSQYAAERLLPKLKARTESDPGASKYCSVDAKFLDACVYLVTWLEYEGEFGGAEFPFARLYPVQGGCYNLSVRRLVDWTRAENYSVTSVDQMFFFQAPSAKFWSKVATHKTFEECIDLLVKDPSF
jgi:hypothetical protein